MDAPCNGSRPPQQSLVELTHETTFMTYVILLSILIPCLHVQQLLMANIISQVSTFGLTFKLIIQNKTEQAINDSTYYVESIQ